MDFEKIVLDLVEPLVDKKESLSVKLMSSLDENEILIYVYADSNDVARLIGRRGVMASSIRQMVSVGSRQMNKKINLKFEAF